MGARSGLLLAALLAVSTAVPAAAQVAVGPAPQPRLDPSGDPALGPSTARVKIVEFCDYQCPYCTRLSGLFRQLTKDYPADVQVVFKDFPLDSHPDADRAAEAASCAGEQGRYWAMHDTLYANNGDLSDNALRRYAQLSGADVKTFMSCFNSGRYESEWRQDRAEGQSNGVTTTPTFFVNGVAREGVPTYAQLVAVVEGELGNR